MLFKLAYILSTVTGGEEGIIEENRPVLFTGAPILLVYFNPSGMVRARVGAGARSLVAHPSVRPPVTSS